MLFRSLQYTTTQKNLVLSCDIPFVSSIILSKLVSETGKEDVLVPEHTGKLEPLCAIYDKCCSDGFKKLIDAGKLGLQKALLEINTVKIKFDFIDGKNINSFVNINTHDELLKYQSKSAEIS